MGIPILSWRLKLGEADSTVKKNLGEIYRVHVFSSVFILVFLDL